MPKLERRMKFAHLHSEVLINCFAGPSSDYCSQLKFKDLPDDFTIISVNWDSCCQCWAVLIYHPSFALIPDFEQFPVFVGEVTVIKTTKYRLFPDLPKYPDPEIEVMCQERDATGKLTHQMGVIRFRTDVRDQMKRYGIKGWDTNHVAIWETGREPLGSNVQVVISQEQYDSLYPKLNGTFIRERDAFRKPDVDLFAPCNLRKTK